MRKYLQILMLIVMVVSFGSIAQGAQKELTMYWCCGTQDRADMWGAMVKEFEAQNPDIKVNLTYPAGGSYINKVKAALLAGTGPDVFWMGQDLYSITDATLPLQDAVAKDSSLKTLPSTILGMNYWLGNLVGVPFGINITSVFYNKSLLAEAGLKMPTSWNGMMLSATDAS